MEHSCHHEPLSLDGNLLRPGTAINSQSYYIKPLLDLLTAELDCCHIMCISYPGQLQRPGIERELSLGCAFTYQPAEFGCWPGWQMGPESGARPEAVGDN